MPNVLIDIIPLDQPTYTGAKIALVLNDGSGNVWNGTTYVAYTNDTALAAGAINPNAGAGSSTVGVVEQGDRAVFEAWVPSAALVTGWFGTYYKLTGSTMVAGDVVNLIGQAGDPLRSQQTKVDLVDAPNGVAVGAIQSGLATSTTQTTILNRLGAITGTGINTVLGYFRALANKLTGLTPTDLTAGGGTFDNTEDSLEAQHDAGASVTVAGYATGQDPATLVLDTPASGHNAAGTVGAKINSAASAGDPWTTDLPGSYAPGEAGNILGNLAHGKNITIVQRPVTINE